MEYYSLEEDEGNAMFLTQQPNENIGQNSDRNEEGEGMFCGVAVTDFQSPCTSMNKQKVAQYSDISDEESSFELPKFK